MSWIERLKQIAGWDLFLEIVAIVVIFALGLFVLLSESCEGEANGRIDANVVSQASAEPGDPARNESSYRERRWQGEREGEE